MKPSTDNSCSKCKVDLINKYQYRIQVYRPGAGHVYINNILAIKIFCEECWHIIAGNEYTFDGTLTTRI